MKESLTYRPNTSSPPHEERNSHFENLLQRLEKKGISITPVFLERLDKLEKKLQRYELDERDKLERYTIVYIYNYLLATGSSSTRSFTVLFRNFNSIVSTIRHPGETECVNNSLSEIRKLFRGLKELGIKISSFTSIYSNLNLPSESAEDILGKFSNLIQLAKETDISFSSISSILSGQGIPDEAGVDRLKSLIQLANGTDISFSSISSILHGQGIPDEAGVDRLKSLIQLANGTDISFSSISSILSGQGIPDEAGVDRLKSLIQLVNGTDISFSSISSILNGQGIPDEAGVERLKSLIDLANEKNIDFSNISSILHGQGIPDEAGVDRLKSLIQLANGTDISFSSISSILNGQGIPDEAGVDRLKSLIQLANGTDISFSSISSILNGQGIPDEAGVERLKSLIQLANGTDISFSSISSILHGQGIPDEKIFQLLTNIINILKTYWVQNQILVKLESILTIYAEIQPNQWEEFTNELISNINKLTSVNIDLNERTLKFISRLTLPKEEKDTDEIIEKASSLLSDFLIDLKIKYDQLSEEEKKPFTNPEQVKQATADLFGIDIPTLKLILAVLGANELTLVHQCKYGERSTPITISLDEEKDDRRSPYESIGKKGSDLEYTDFKLDLDLLLNEVINNPQKYPNFPVELLKKLIEEGDLSVDEFKELGSHIKKYPPLLRFFLGT